MPRRSSAISAFLASAIILIFLFDWSGGDVRPLSDRYFKNPSQWRLAAFTYMIGVRSSDVDIEDERPVWFMFRSFMKDTGFIGTIYDSESDVILTALRDPKHYVKFSPDIDGQVIQHLESCSEEKIGNYYKVICINYNGSIQIYNLPKSKILSAGDEYFHRFIFCSGTNKFNYTASLDELKSISRINNSSCSLSIKENGVNLNISMLTEREAMHILHQKKLLFSATK